MSVVHQPSVKTALHLGKCYKCVDEVKLAIESYNRNDSTSWKKKSLYRQCTHNKTYKSDGPHSKVKQCKQKMCHACITYNKSQRSGDNALKLTKAYISLLNELDKLEEDSLKGIDKDFVQDIEKVNDQLHQINSVLLKKAGGNHPQIFREFRDERRETLSLDALEEFLGNLMEEAEEIERQSNLKDTKKYKMVMPLLTRIGKMISHHPTKQFLSYHEHLGKLEAAIRVSHRGNEESKEHETSILTDFHNNNENSFKPIKDLKSTIAACDSVEEIDSNFQSASLDSDTISTTDTNDSETEI